MLMVCLKIKPGIWLKGKISNSGKSVGRQNEFKRQLIDEVVGTALPENENADALGATVKAFMDASLPNELIELLEKIILQGHTDFSTNENLQNLLILDSNQSRCTAVAGYIERLDNFNGPAIAKIARSEEYELFEEAS